MFGGHWSNPNGDKKSLICNVTPQNHMIEGSCNSYVTTLPSSMTVGIALVETTGLEMTIWIEA